MSDHVAVYMLDVGQGDSSIVLLPDGRVVIFDCADDHVLRKTLVNWGSPTIVAFVLSHLDQDHIGGALSFLKDYRGTVEKIYLSADRPVSDADEAAARAKALLEYAKERGRDEGARRRRWELGPNTRDSRPVASGSGWSVNLLAPSHGQQIQREREGEWQDANRYSSILRVQAGPKAMLIGGDAPLLSWSELPAEERRAEVFRVPHHGGALDDGGIPAGWHAGRLYREIGATTALISVGTNNPHGHPIESWVEPIRGDACRLLCTQVTPRCHKRIETRGADGRRQRDPAEIDVLRRRIIHEHQQWAEPQYRHLTDRRREVKASLLEVPCAGTVVVKLSLNGEVEVLPARGGQHERIVDDWEHPLCRRPEL